MRTHLLALVAAAFTAAVALAGDRMTDVSGLYKVSTEGSTTQLQAGQKGKLVLSIKLDKVAHLSEEAPLRISLSGTGGAVPEKASLVYADQVSQKATGQQYVNPVVFEVPFSVAELPAAKPDAKAPPLAATVDARMTFFVCTADICSRQQQQVSLPVKVCRGSAGTC